MELVFRLDYIFQKSDIEHCKNSFFILSTIMIPFMIIKALRVLMGMAAFKCVSLKIGRFSVR